jgi:hypothetical protein
MQFITHRAPSLEQFVDVPQFDASNLSSFRHPAKSYPFVEERRRNREGRCRLFPAKSEPRLRIRSRKRNLGLHVSRLLWKHFPHRSLLLVNRSARNFSFSWPGLVLFLPSISNSESAIAIDASTARHSPRRFTTMVISLSPRIFSAAT